MTGFLILGGLLVAYALVAARAEHLHITGPMVFVAVGFALGSGGLSIIDIGPNSALVRGTASITLGLLLFSDAAAMRPRVISQDAGMIIRLVLVALPLTLAFGAGIGWLLVPALGIGGAALLAAILAPTDLSLGLAMLNNPRVPELVRGALNGESGLNDGVAAPFVTFFIGVVIAESMHKSSPVVEAVVEIALGVGIGCALGLVGGLLLRLSQRADWSSTASRQFAALTLAILSYEVTKRLGGNGYIGAFAGGLTFGIMAKDAAHQAVEFAERIGTVMTFGMWFLLGAVIAPIMVSDGLSWRPILYAVLTLTVVRMAAVALSLLGAKLHRSTVVFAGWFGPRGMASVVFLLLAYEWLTEAGVPTRLLVVTVSWTVILSVVLHGLTAGPVAAWYAARAERFAPGSPELQPTAETSARRGLSLPTSSRLAE